MRTADNLKLVKLEPENTSSVLDESSKAECACRCPRVEGCGQVPHFDFSVVSKRNERVFE